MSLSHLLHNLNNSVVSIQNKHNKVRPEKINKLIDYQHASILYANDTYKKKMNRSQNQYDIYTFASQTEFQKYIDDDLKDLPWKDLPLSNRYKLVVDFIKNDETLTEIEKNNIELKVMSNLKNKVHFVTYDKSTNSITSIDYVKLLL